MLSPLVIALQGFTSTPLAVALQGFVVIEVPLQVTGGGGGGGYVRRKVKAARRLNDFLDKVLREELVEELVEDAVEAVKELAEEKQSVRSALTEFVEGFAEERNLPDIREVVRKALAAVERGLKERELEEEEEFVVLTLLFS